MWARWQGSVVQMLLLIKFGWWTVVGLCCVAWVARDGCRANPTVPMPHLNLEDGSIHVGIIYAFELPFPPPHWGCPLWMTPLPLSPNLHIRFRARTRKIERTPLGLWRSSTRKTWKYEVSLTSRSFCMCRPLNWFFIESWYNRDCSHACSSAWVKFSNWSPRYVCTVTCKTHLGLYVYLYNPVIVVVVPTCVLSFFRPVLYTVLGMS